MPARPALTACGVALVLAMACADDDVAGPGSSAGPAPTPAPGAGQGAEHLEDIGSEAWIELSGAPVALTEVDAAALDGELWVVGGFEHGGGVVGLVQIYNPVTDAWRAGPELPDPVHHASVVATGDTLVVLGGYRSTAFDPVADVLVLDREAGAWVQGPPLPAARGAGAAEYDGTRIVYGGGVGTGGLAADVWALDVAELTDPRLGWVDIGQLSIARDHLDAASDRDGTVWFLAGREQGLERNLGTVDVVQGDEVGVLGELPTARGGVAAFFLPQHGACLSGGESPEATFDEVECIDVDGRVTTLPPLGHARHGHGADVIDGVVLVALGGPEPFLTVSSSLEALRPL